MKFIRNNKKSLIPILIIILITLSNLPNSIESKNKLKSKSKRWSYQVYLNTNFARSRPCKIFLGAKSYSFDINFGNYIYKDNLPAANLEINKIIVKNTLLSNYANTCKYKISVCSDIKLQNCKQLSGKLEPGKSEDIFKVSPIKTIKSIRGKNYLSRLPCEEKCGITFQGKKYKGCGGELSLLHVNEKAKPQLFKMYDDSGKGCVCRWVAFSRTDFDGTKKGYKMQSWASYENVSNFYVKSLWHECVSQSSKKLDYYGNQY